MNIFLNQFWCRVHEIGPWSLWNGRLECWILWALSDYSDIHRSNPKLSTVIGNSLTNNSKGGKSSETANQHYTTRWRHQMETFSAVLALCARNSPVTSEFLSQRSVTRSFDVFFDLRLNKRLSKHSWGWWFETPARSLWRHCNDETAIQHYTDISWMQYKPEQTICGCSSFVRKYAERFVLICLH